MVEKEISKKFVVVEGRIIWWGEQNTVLASLMRKQEGMCDVLQWQGLERRWEYFWSWRLGDHSCPPSSMAFLQLQRASLLTSCPMLTAAELWWTYPKFVPPVTSGSPHSNSSPFQFLKAGIKADQSPPFPFVKQDSCFSHIKIIRWSLYTDNSS